MFDKNLGKFDVVSIALGAIIGWGAFVLPGDLFLSEVGIFNSMIGLAIGTLVMVIIEKNYHYLISRFPVSGGEFAFTYSSLGWKNAYICGWFLSLAYICIVPLNATALALVFKAIFPGVLEFGSLYTIAGYEIFLGEVLLPSAVLILFFFLNIKGVKMASKFQNIMVLFLVGIVFLFLSIILAKSGFDNENFLSHVANEKINLSFILKVVAISPWAFIGFDAIPQVAEELSFDTDQVSKLAIFSIIMGLIVYIIMIIVTAMGVSFADVTSGKISWATGASIEYYFGKIGVYALGIALISAIIAGINGFFIASSRLLFSMGRGKVLPAFFEQLDPNTKQPKNALFFVLIFSLVAPWLGRKALLWIVDMSSVGAAIGYFYACLSAYMHYYKDNKKPLWSGMIGAIFGLIFIGLLVIPGFSTSLGKESMILMGVWVALGVIFYLFYDIEIKHLENHEIDKLILGKGEEESIEE